MAELPFDPAEEPSTTEPAEMSDAERQVAALRTIYEIERMRESISASMEYLGELLGLDPADVAGVVAQARHDELHR